jgi:hypothetical protein
LAEMRALLQVMAGRASPHTPQPVAQEQIPERASVPGQASAPVVGPQPGFGQDEPPAPVTLPQIPERGEPSCSRRPGKEPVGAVDTPFCPGCRSQHQLSLIWICTLLTCIRLDLARINPTQTPFGPISLIRPTSARLA